MARELSKRYPGPTPEDPGTLAVDRLTFEVRRGEIFGLLGPNGAGKTTTILMLLGLTEPTSGEARVLGHDPAREPLAVKRRVGYLPDSVGFYDDLTAEENLLYTADLNGIAADEAARRARERLREVGLEYARHTRVGAFSRGMRQRLGVADALLKDPEVLILDEPTLGIDPEGVRDMLALIRELAGRRGLAVLVSSHLLHQVQEICDRVGIFVGGRLVAAGRVEELAARLFGGEPVEVEVRLCRADERARDAIAKLPFVRDVRPGDDPRTLRATCEARAPGAGGEPDEPGARLARALVEAGFDIVGLSVRGRGLDDIYHRYFEGAEPGREARGSLAGRARSLDAGRPRDGAADEAAAGPVGAFVGRLRRLLPGKGGDGR
ncbi:MAG: ABC transporter ATP-binding protein [Clostridia bacterium]|nr:ABC transporter ATP-binding protein [Clostridia bacterium]